MAEGKPKVQEHDALPARLADIVARAAAAAGAHVADGRLAAPFAAAVDEICAEVDALRVSEQRFRVAAEIAQAIVYERDFITGIATFYGDVDAALGYASGEYPRTMAGWADLVHPDDLRRVMDEIQDNFQAGRPNALRYRLRRKDGVYSNWYDPSILIRGKDGAPLKWIGVSADITAQVIADRALHESRQMLRLVLDAIPVGVFWLDRDLKYIGCNQKFAADAGLDSTEAIAGKTDFDLPWADRAELYRHDDQRVVDTGIRMIDYEEPMTTADGSRIWVRTSKMPLFDGDRKISGLLGVYQDITVWKQFEEQLKHSATHDSLTGLPNRVVLQDRLEQISSRARRNKDHSAFLLLDLDHFKDVNDNFGHSAGDEVLRQVARRLSACVRPYDALARLGGDEFVIVLGDLTHAQDAASVARRVIESLAQPVLLGGRKLEVVCSVGLTIIPPNGGDVETLLKEADRAMYIAKEKGGGDYCFYSPALSVTTDERAALVGELRDALANHEFTLHYQPIVDLAKKHFASIEALLRWTHPKNGLIYPLGFIDVAESSELIVPIGDWALREACRQNAAWLRAGLLDAPVAVNISARQVFDPDLPAKIAATLHDSGLPASHLAIEIAEAAAMQNLDAAAIALRAVRALGVQIVLDDFGSGNSSLTWLKRLPVDVIKIDRYLIRHLLDDPDNRAVIRVIFVIANSLNVKVVAKGVETEEQFNVLRSLRDQGPASADIFEGQGYLFSRPVPADAFEKLIREQHGQ